MGSKFSIVPLGKILHSALLGTPCLGLGNSLSGTGDTPPAWDWGTPSGIGGSSPVPPETGVPPVWDWLPPIRDWGTPRWDMGPDTRVPTL